MQNKNSSDPLMFIQTIALPSSKSSNQTIFDSRYQASTKSIKTTQIIPQVSSELVEISKAIDSSLYLKIQKIIRANKYSNLVASEVVLSNETITGYIKECDDQSILIQTNTEEMFVPHEEIKDVYITQISEELITKKSTNS